MLHSLYLFISIHSYFFVYSSFSRIYTGNNNYSCRIKLEIIPLRYKILLFMYLSYRSWSISNCNLQILPSIFLTHTSIFKIICNFFFNGIIQASCRISIISLARIIKKRNKYFNQLDINNRKNPFTIFVELLSELSYVFQFHQKRKRGEKKEESFERIFRTSTNFQFLEWLDESFIHNRSETFQIVSESISRHVCGVSFPNRSKRAFQFSRNENLQLSTHTHTCTHDAKECTRHQKVTQLSRSVVAPFPLPSLVLFHPVIAIYALARPFLLVSHCLSIPNQRFLSRFIDLLATSRYYRLSNRFLRHLSTCTNVTQNIYETWTKFLLSNYFVFFFFCFFCLLSDCC